MRTLTLSLLSLYFSIVAAVHPAEALRVLPITTIVELTPELLESYIACRPGVNSAAKRASATIVGMTYNDALKRLDAVRAATKEALEVCGFKNPKNWEIVFHSVQAALRNCCATKVRLPDSAIQTEQGVAAVQAANRRLLRKYPRSKL